jgi:hypothetical protein
MTSHPAIETLASRNAIPNTVCLIHGGWKHVNHSKSRDPYIFRISRVVFFSVIRNLFYHPTAIRVFRSLIHSFSLVLHTYIRGMRKQSSLSLNALKIQSQWTGDTNEWTKHRCIEPYTKCNVSNSYNRWQHRTIHAIKKSLQAYLSLLPEV